MTEAERLVMRKLIAANKGARDSLDKAKRGLPPNASRLDRDIARLEEALGAGEAMLAGAGAR